MTKYIKVGDLQSFCDNQKDHAITPNEFQRMNHYEFGWHTGTPTEEGYYLIHLKKYYYKDTVGYIVAKFERNLWRTVNLGSCWNLGEDIDAWQKIEPFAEVSNYECPHYQGVCGLDESIICFSKSNKNCNIRLEAST